MHAFIHTYIHTYIHAVMHTCMDASIHTCMHTYMHAYTHAYIHTHACLHLPHACTHTRLLDAPVHKWGGGGGTPLGVFNIMSVNIIICVSVQAGHPL